MPQIDAIIFDFDGLVIDTESPAFDAWSAIYQEHGQTLALAEWVACVGSSYDAFDPVAHLAQLTGKRFDRAAMIADKEARKAAICNRLQPLPGVVDRMDEARDLGLKLAVASSSGRGWIHAHLERLGLTPRLHAVRTRDDVTRVKPHPDLYLAAAAALGVDPARCLAFEDSANGVKAAKAAGMICYAVPNAITRALDFSRADGVVASLAELSLARLLG